VSLLSLADPVSSMQSLWNASTVGEIMNVSGRSAFAVLPYDASLWYSPLSVREGMVLADGLLSPHPRDALERLGKGGAHSVVVMNENGSGPEALYSQGAVLEYLFQHLDRFSSIARRLVHQIGSFSQVGSQKPLYISEEDTLLSGLRLLHEQVKEHPSRRLPLTKSRSPGSNRIDGDQPPQETHGCD